MNHIKKQAPYLLANDVAIICEPLFKALGFNYFDYVRVYPDNSCLVLVSDPEWYFHYVKSKYPSSGTILTSGAHLWNIYAPEDAIKDHANHFDHCNGITIFLNNKDYIEYIDLATPSSNYAINDIYLNKLYLLNQFVFYFRDKAAALIEIADKQRIILPSANLTPTLSVADQYEDFRNIIKTNNYNMRFGDKYVNLTKREYESLLHLTSGKTMKETARFLGISPKTVEEYLTKAKNKIGCISRVQLINDFYDNFTKSLLIKPG